MTYDPEQLYPSVDPQAWAEAFREAIHVDVDDGTLQEWFAQAIRSGAAFGRNQAARQAAKATQANTTAPPQTT